MCDFSTYKNNGIIFNILQKKKHNCHSVKPGRIVGGWLAPIPKEGLVFHNWLP